jgi:hypothetical protein
LKAGFDHHLVKPVDFAKIQTILETAAKGCATITTERLALGSGTGELDRVRSQPPC